MRPELDTDPPSTAHRASDARLVFGPFTLDPASGELRREDRIVPLRPLAIRALILLTERPGQLVPREDLRRRLCGGISGEWETGVHQVISQLRRALSDDPRSPAFIETVPRRGYRFTAPVREENRYAIGQPDKDQRVRRRSPSWAFVGGAATTLGMVVLLVLFCCVLLAP